MALSIKGLLKTVLAIFAMAPAAKAQTLHYPDHWEGYVVERDGAPVSVAYNVGIGTVLDQLGGTGKIVTFRIALQEAHPDGLPTNAEDDRLMGLDVLLDPVMVQEGFHYLGRITSEGERRYFIMTDLDSAALGEALLNVAQGQGYQADYQEVPDPDHLIYRTKLTPSPDERRMTGDLAVLLDLERNGDLAQTLRPVDHWAFFGTAEAAAAFAAWAEQNGFAAVETTHQPGRPLPYAVHSTHTGTMLPEDILRKTRAQDQQARALGGQYDGWETSVMRAAE